MKRAFPRKHLIDVRILRRNESIHRTGKRPGQLIELASKPLPKCGAFPVDNHAIKVRDGC
jgi:hypothetical protein